MNYYDDRKLADAITPFITSATNRQIELGGRRERAIVLGTGENARFFQKLNDKHHFFREILPLEHPRFIMQYRRKRLDEYLAKYAEVFARAESR